MYIVFVQISVKFLGNKFDRIHIGDRALSRTKDNCTCLAHPLIEKQCSGNAFALVRLITRFLCAVQH